MPLTSEQVVSAVTSRRDAMSRGRLMFLREANRGESRPRQLLEELLDQPDAPGKPYDDPTVYRPGREFLDSGGRGRTLTASDVAWLQRLPNDPERVSDADASALAAMALEVADGTGDARLVAAVFEPVRRLHAKRAAEVELRNARAATPRQAPARAIEALADVLRREVPGLGEDEALSLAGSRLREAAQAAEAEHDAAVRAAQERLAERTRAAQLTDLSREAA